MQMQRSRVVGLANLLRVNLVEPVIPADLAGDVVIEPLEGVVHVTVLPDFPVLAPQIGVHQIHARLLDHLANAAVLVTVQYVGLGGSCER